MGNYRARRRTACRLSTLQARFAGNAALSADACALDADQALDAIDEDVDFETHDEFSVPDDFDPADYDDDMPDDGADVFVGPATPAPALHVVPDALQEDHEESLTSLDSADVEVDVTHEPARAHPSDLASFDVADVEDDEPPFDPPEEAGDDAPSAAPEVAAEAAISTTPPSALAPTPAPAPVPAPAVVPTSTPAPTREPLVLVTEAPSQPRPAGLADLRAPPAASAPCRPAPPISIHMSWERPEAAHLAAALTADRRLLQAVVTQSGGGLERVAAECAGDEPDLVIVDTTLAARPMLAAFDRAKAALKPGAKIVVLGRVNDVALLRELLRRGASHYLLHPVDPDQLVRLICELYEDADNARVIAVIGARGGVGASTIAHNLAWCIGAKRQAATTLADFDLSFGAAAFGFNPTSRPYSSPLLTGDLDDERLEQDALRPHPRLRVLAAPATLSADAALDPVAVEALIGHLRRTSTFVVLDLPHAWSSGVREALWLADEIILVAAPDLASMRNTKNMLDALSRNRPSGREPLVVLSMVGAPKRPEIAPKEFAEAIGTEPVCSLMFDAGVFGLAELKNLPLDEVAPASKQAALLDALAEDLSGLKVKAAPPRPAVVVPPPAPELELSLDMRIDPPAPAPVPAPPPKVEPTPPAPVSRAPAAPRRPKRLAQLTGVPRRRRGRPGTIRTAAAVVALGLMGGWFLGQNGFHPQFIGNYLNALAVDLSG